MTHDLISPELTLPGPRATPLRRITAALLIAASSALARLAARVEARRSAAPVAEATVEFTAIEVDGRRCGAVYKNGRLIGYVQDVHRF